MQKSLQELMDTVKAFSSLSKAKGAAHAYSKYLNRNAVMLPHNQKPIKGFKNIVKAMRADEKEVLTWKPQGGKVSDQKILALHGASIQLRLLTEKGLKENI